MKEIIGWLLILLGPVYALGLLAAQLAKAGRV